MKLTINKINEEKFEFIIENNGNIIFNNIVFHTYMDKTMFDENKINEMIVQLKTLHDITETINNFSI
jgi:hypothetical protein